jgi:hypothetical protein
MSTPEAASGYIARGWAPIPIPSGRKRPTLSGWPALRVSQATLSQYFNGHSQNVGILLGAPSGGLVDVDLDAPEALQLSDEFLPPTASVFGRPSKPLSHRLYVAGPPVNTIRFEDTGGASLVEMRSTGAQTVFPPSTHPSGETVAWERDGEPARLDGRILHARAARLASAAMFARHWPAKGSRHEAAKALAGALLRAGWDPEEAEDFILSMTLVAGDEEARDRPDNVRTTVRRLAQDRPATGRSTLAELLGAAVVDRAWAWLGLSRAHTGGGGDHLAEARLVLDGIEDLANGGAAKIFAPEAIAALATAYTLDPAVYGAAKARLKGKVNIPDLERAVRAEERRRRREEPAEEDEGEAADPFEYWRDGEYRVRDGQFFRQVAVKDRLVERPISNFAARVIEEVTRDDGADQQKVFVAEGRLRGGRPLPRRDVPASQFDGLAWPPKVWGLEPSALPGQKEHVPYAIRLLSGQVPRRVIFTHLGWRRLDDGPAFLYAGGALGADAVEVDVAQDGLARYVLPIDPGDVRGAVEASLQFLEVGSPQVTYPAWGLPWRAVVCEFLPCTVLPHWVGGTGQLKSTLAAAELAHFGHFRTKEDLPARWEFTDNILEKGAFLAKDVLFVIDDLNPEHTRVRKEDLEQRFSRLVGDIGNNTGRRRMGSDLRTRLEYRPRGLALSTGEYTPTLATSRLARLFPVPFDPGAVDRARLAVVQRRLDLLPYAMRAFIDYLRDDFDGLDVRLQERFEHLRGKASELAALHSRLPENVAHLYLGLELGIGFAVRVGALDEHDAVRHLSTGWGVLMDLARAHGKALGEERPTQAFLGAIGEALASGTAWLADRKTGAVAAGMDASSTRKLGWTDTEGIYLLPSLSFEFANDRLRYRGGVHLSERALHGMLAQEGYILREPSEPDRLTPNRWCEGASRRVLWLKLGALGDLPAPRRRSTNCWSCGDELTSDRNTKCPRCGWLACACGACGCGRDRR